MLPPTQNAAWVWAKGRTKQTVRGHWPDELVWTNVWGHAASIMRAIFYSKGTGHMKNSLKSLLVAAAMTGLLGATAAPVALADDKPATTDTKDASKDGKTKKAKKKDASKDSKDAKAKDKNSCKSANGCSSKDEKK
jgi:hypothetical protein